MLFVVVFSKGPDTTPKSLETAGCVVPSDLPSATEMFDKLKQNNRFVFKSGYNGPARPNYSVDVTEGAVFVGLPSGSDNLSKLLTCSSQVTIKNLVESGMTVVLPASTENKTLAALLFLIGKENFEQKIKFGDIENSTANHLWKQDIGESLNNGKYLIPKSRENAGYARASKERLDSMQIKNTTVPFTFDGGNLLIGSNDSGPLLFAGAKSTPSLNDLPKMAKAFEVRKVIPLGDSSLSSAMFHIDQIMMPVADNIVLLASPPVSGRKWPDDEIKHLALIKEQLKANGVQTIEVPTSAEQVRQSQSFVNSFVRSKNGQPLLLVPIFPDADGRVSETLEPNLSALKAIRDGFQRLGIKGEIIPTPNFTFELQGNINCMTGPIASIKNKRTEVG